MAKELLNYYINSPEPIKGCLIALRSIILEYDINISETQKYGMPCFCYKNRTFCYLWTEKKTVLPYILFVEGKYLNHPELEEGDRKKMKILKVNPNTDLPLITIQNLLKNALDLYKTGVIVIK